MKIFKFLFKLIFLLVIVLGVTGIFLSKEFEISRSHIVNSSHPRIILHITNMEKWPSWWPWTKGDQQFTSSEHGTNEGAKFSWKGNPAPGHLVITKNSIYSVEYDVILEGKSEPLKGAFEFKPIEENKTEVTWKVKGKFETLFFAPYLAMMADSMHGGMLSWGLKRFSQEVEKDISEIEIIS